MNILKQDFLHCDKATRDLLHLPSLLKYSSFDGVCEQGIKIREDRTALNQIFSFVVTLARGLFEVLIEVARFIRCTVRLLSSLS